MPNCQSVIEAFCKGLNEDRELFSQQNPNGKNVFVSITPIPTFKCRVCDRLGDILGGVPHDGISTVFDQTFNRMWPVSELHLILLELGISEVISYIIQEYFKDFVIDFSFNENTPIIYVIPGGVETRTINLNGNDVQISHYNTVVRCNFQRNVINKFFSGRLPRVGTVKALRNKMSSWFNNNNDNFYELMIELRNNVKVSVATAFNDLYHIMRLISWTGFTKT